MWNHCSYVWISSWKWTRTKWSELSWNLCPTSAFFVVSLFPVLAFFMMTLLSIPFKITLSLWHFSVSYVVCLYQNIPNQNETLVQSNNIHIQFLLNRVSKLDGFDLNWQKSSIAEIKKYVLWPYVYVSRVLAQCLFSKAQLVENHLWLSACGCNDLTNTGICSTQSAIFALHPFTTNADVQELVLCKSQHDITEFSGLDHVSPSLREVFMPWGGGADKYEQRSRKLAKSSALRK